MLSIVVPLYNESETILALYQEVVDALEGFPQSFELVFVNDGSTDDSAKKLFDLAKQDERVKVITFTGNFGQTAAMMAGFQAAAGDIIVPMDGDLQNDPADIPMLVEKLDEGYDVVSGWRKERHGTASSGASYTDSSSSSNPDPGGWDMAGGKLARAERKWPIE